MRSWPDIATSRGCVNRLLTRLGDHVIITSQGVIAVRLYVATLIICIVTWSIVAVVSYRYMVALEKSFSDADRV